MSDIHVEKLLGRTVRDPAGKSVGHIEEIVIAGNLVDEYHIGTAAVLERLSMTARLFFPGKRRISALVARWDQLDLSDPQKPVLTCPAEDLRRLK